MREELIKISKTEWDAAKGHFNNDPDAVEFLPNQAGTDKKKSTFSFRKKDGKIYALANQYCFDSRGTSLKLMLPDKGSIKKVRLMQRESGENYALVVMEDNKRLIMPVEEFQKSIYVPANHVLNDAKVLLKYILNVPPFLKGGECKINISDDQFNTIDKIVSLRPPEDGYLLINDQDRSVLDQALLILDPLHHIPSATFQEGARPSDKIDDQIDSILKDIDQFSYGKSDADKDTQEKIVEQSRQTEMLNEHSPAKAVESVDPVDAKFALDILLTLLEESEKSDTPIKIGEDLTEEELDVIESTLNVELEKKDGYLIINDDIIDLIGNKLIKLEGQSQDIRSVTEWKPAFPRKLSDKIADEIEKKISKEIEEELAAEKISKEMEEDLAKKNIELIPFEFEKTRKEIDKKLSIEKLEEIYEELQEENIVVSGLRGLGYSINEKAEVISGLRGLDYSKNEKAEIKLKQASDKEQASDEKFFPMPIDPERIKELEELIAGIEEDRGKIREIEELEKSIIDLKNLSENLTKDAPVIQELEESVTDLKELSEKLTEDAPRSDINIKDEDLTFSNTKNKETQTPIKETSRSVQHAQDIIKSLIPPKPVFPRLSDGDGVIKILNEFNPDRKQREKTQLYTDYVEKRTTKGLYLFFQDRNIRADNISKDRDGQIDQINDTIQKLLAAKEKLNPHEKGVILYGILEQIKMETSKTSTLEFKSRLNQTCSLLQKRLIDEGKITPPEDLQFARQLSSEFLLKGVNGFKNCIKDHQEKLKAENKDLELKNRKPYKL